MDPLRFATSVTTQTNYINDNKQKPTIFTKDVTHLQSKKWSNGSGVFVSHKSPGFMCDRGSLEVFLSPIGKEVTNLQPFEKDLTKNSPGPKKAHVFLATELPGISELVPTSFS